MIDRFLPLLHELKQRGIDNSWLVGGAVRDCLLAREPSDIDIVCAEPDAGALVSKTGGAIVGKPPFCTVSAFLSGLHVEIAVMTGASIQKDLERRDFTINAIAAGADGNLIDPFGGAEDIRRGVLRLVPAPASPYDADPVRVLRLLRFACTLNFAVESQTEIYTKKFVREHRAELTGVPRERYGKEFLKGFASRPYDFLTLLENYSLLPAVLPEIEAMRGVEQPVIFHPEGDVLVHTFHVLAEVQKLIESRRSGDAVLALAALFHDAGKPQTVRPHPKYGHSCFFGHDEAGERITIDTLGAWAVPGNVTSRAASLVRYHMIPGGDFTERTCVKLIRKLDSAGQSGVGDEAAPLTERLFDLALCDARGTLSAGENILAARSLFRGVRDNLLRAKETSSKRWLNGHDVMEILGIPPGREVGRILEELDLAVGSGQLHNKEEAAEWLRTNGSVRSEDASLEKC